MALIGRGTADKDVLPRFILKQADITLYVFCRITDELRNHIVMFKCDGFATASSSLISAMIL